MPKTPSEFAELSFQNLISSNEVEFIREEEDLHIAGDDWTLVLEGDPITDVLVALDDEGGTPEEALRDAISETALDAMRDLDAKLDGDLVTKLTDSPDILAQSLSELLER